MKYNVYVAEHGFGVCDKPEHHFGAKKIIDKFYDDEREAREVIANEVRRLFDEVELCREWIVIGEDWIKTKIGSEDGWYHEYEAILTKFTDEEYKELMDEDC